MVPVRVIPVLLLKGAGLVKTVKFKDPKYVGDPINAVRIFNDKGVDELVFLDITATREGREPDYRRIGDIATECFMPFAYGGGVRTIEQARKILQRGCEKVIVNAMAIDNQDFVSEASGVFGSQSVVVSIDVKKSMLGKYQVWSHVTAKSTREDPAGFARNMEKKGAGEILLNSVDRDGTFSGYDIDLVRQVAASVSIPVVACGGAGSVEDFGRVVRDGGASAVAAGSFFVFHGPRRAVIITYPEPGQLAAVFSPKPKG